MYKEPEDSSEKILYSLRKNKDTSDVIMCPACGHEMLKIFVEGLGFNIDICTTGCGGIFFDNREMEVLQTPDMNIDEILKLIKVDEFIKVDDSAKRRCPSCNTVMLKNRVRNTDVNIDLCPVCGGKFLDNGELEQIRNSYLGKYEKSVIEFALKNPKSFSIICSEVIRKSSI